MRATIDLDHPSVPDVRRAWEILSEHGDGRVYARVSSSGTGVHLKVHGCEPAEAELLRAVCGDDATRRRFDQEAELKPPQILFSSKGDGREAGEWHRELAPVIEEYGERAPPAYARRALLVIYPILRELDLDLGDPRAVVQS